MTTPRANPLNVAGCVVKWTEFAAMGYINCCVEREYASARNFSAGGGEINKKGARCSRWRFELKFRREISRAWQNRLESSAGCFRHELPRQPLRNCFR